MAPPLNPKNVPTGGDMTYTALEAVTHKQLRMLGHLRSLAGDPPTWEATCRIILGDDWDGIYATLSKAAASWLIHGLQRGLLAVAEKDDLYIEGSPV